MADLVYYVTQNPPPVHFFLISSDKDFANILHRLRMSNYNILLAGNDPAADTLCSAATVMWPWRELVKGENVPVKHFNHPPDGFYGSWYGQYKGAPDDPFLNSEQCAVSQAEESMESISETKIRPIPRVVVNRIRNILHSYPEGMYISSLRDELIKNNIAFDKDFYGHTKFSNLLASMPSIVKFIPNSSGGQPLVAGKRLVESAKTTSRASNDSVDLRSKNVKESQTCKVEKNRALTQDDKPLPVAPLDTVDVKSDVPTPIPADVNDAVIPNSSGDGQPLVADKRLVESAETTSKTSNDSVDHRSKNDKEAQTCMVEKNHALTQDEKPLQVAPPDTIDVKSDVPIPIPADVNAAVPIPILPHNAVEKRVETAESTTTEQGHDAEVKEGFFKRIWATLTGRRNGHPTSSDKSDTMSEVDSTSIGETIKGRDSKKIDSKEKTALPKDNTSSSNAFGTNKSVPEEKRIVQSEKHNETSNIKVIFFSRLANWWQPRKFGAKDHGQNFESVGKILEADGNEGHVKDPVICHPETHALFSRSQFWDAFESFLFTSKGADLIVKSTTRFRVRGGDRL